MSDQINAFFQFFEVKLGLRPTIIATIALVVIPVLIFLLLLLLSKLRSARDIIGQLAKRLGYEPPFDDGMEILHEEFKKEVVERGKDKKIEQLELRIEDLMVQGTKKEASLTAAQQRAKELEEQLQQTLGRSDEVMAQANEQAQAHRIAAEQFEQHMRNMEAGHVSSLGAAQQRAIELEELLQQATHRNDEVMAQAGEQVQARQAAVEQLEQRIRDMESDHVGNLRALQQRWNELEEELRQASLQNEMLTAQAGDQAQAHRTTVEQLEQRIHETETESGANLAAFEQRSSELTEQVQQLSLENENLRSQAGEQARVHESAREQLELRIHDLETASVAKLAALEQRSKGLEDQLQQATLQNESMATQADEQARAHRTFVEQLEQRIREIDAESFANLSALEQHSRELEEQLRQAAQEREQVAAQAGEQAQTHRTTVEQLEQRIRDLEAGSFSNQAEIEQRSRELEEQLRQATQRHEQVAAQAGEQAQTHRTTVEQLEQRIREMEAGSFANQAEIEQRSRELEERLRQATEQHEQVAARAREQAQTHRTTVEQLEQRIREMEAGSFANQAEIEQRSRELEERLRQATEQHEQVAAQAGEQAQTHRTTVEQLEQRIRDMEAESSTNLAALEQRSRDLEEQLQIAKGQNENEGSIATQEALEQRAELERLGMRIRDLEAEKLAGEFHLKTVQAQVKELEAQLQLTADRTASERTVATEADTANGEASKMEAAVNASAQLLRRAEWITGCAIGAIRPLGVVAAEAYAIAAFAADPHNLAASQLLAELTKLRRSSIERLPSVIEAVATFDQGAAGFFGSDRAGNADLAEREAQRRYHAGLDRSALLALNMSLALRQQTGGDESKGTQKLQEMKITLLERIGNKV